MPCSEADPSPPDVTSRRLPGKPMRSTSRATTLVVASAGGRPNMVTLRLDDPAFTVRTQSGWSGLSAYDPVTRCSTSVYPPHMLRRLPLRSLWKILSETNLEAIRRGAESRFEVLVAGEDRAGAEQLATMIGDTGDGAAHPGDLAQTHPWLQVTDATTAAPALG